MCDILNEDGEDYEDEHCLVGYAIDAEKERIVEKNLRQKEINENIRKFNTNNYTSANIIRKFDTGATRDVDINKPDYEGFLSPLVIEEFGRYMHKHRMQNDGTLRSSDNWTKGIPKDAYIKSGYRHFMDWWLIHRNFKEKSREDIKEALCALMFNTMGYLFEVLKDENTNNVTGKD